MEAPFSLAPKRVPTDACAEPRLGQVAEQEFGLEDAAQVPVGEVLQLCSHPVVGWPDASPGLFGLRSIQVAPV